MTKEQKLAIMRSILDLETRAMALEVEMRNADLPTGDWEVHVTRRISAEFSRISRMDTE